MARPLRIDLAGGLCDMMARGNDRRAIVRDDTDRQRRLDWLDRFFMLKALVHGKAVTNA